VGGISALNPGAMTEAITSIPLADYFQPLERGRNPESIYVGVMLLILAAGTMLVRRGGNPITIALTLTGLLGVSITLDGINQLFNQLPMHHLLWPLRFLGVASFMLLLALLWRVQGWRHAYPLFVLPALLLLGLDNAGSLQLVHLREPRQNIIGASHSLARSTGWRVATLDLSRWGSTPTYLFSSLGGREQVFGWAYQGASTARTVAALNEAIEMGDINYLIDRLDLLGVDDVAIHPDLPNGKAIAQSLAAGGFQQTYSSAELSLYHRDGGPRALAVDRTAIGIGNGAQNLAYLFPQIILGTSAKIDEYDLRDLTKYRLLVLSGFTWRDREKAEDLVKEVMAAGVRVVIDLTGVQEDPVARIPRFLGVWGERIILAKESIRISGSNKTYALRPFEGEDELWYTITPQNLSGETLSMNYLGEETSVLGYIEQQGYKAWFLGLNLPYLARLNHDPTAIDLLAEVLQLEPGRRQDYRSIPLTDYQADQDGYRFEYQMDAPETLLVPLAYHDGAYVTIDGLEGRLQSFEHLVAFEAPAGEHTVEVRLAPSRYHMSGWGICGLSLAILLFSHVRRKR